jgi:hypothetical protein
VIFFSCLSTENSKIKLLKRQIVMLSSFYVGVNYQVGQLLGHGSLWQREKFMFFWVSLCLWELFKNLSKKVCRGRWGTVKQTVLSWSALHQEVGPPSGNSWTWFSAVDPVLKWLLSFGYMCYSSCHLIVKQVICSCTTHIVFHNITINLRSSGLLIEATIVLPTTQVCNNYLFSNGICVITCYL